MLQSKQSLTGSTYSFGTVHCKMFFKNIWNSQAYPILILVFHLFLNANQQIIPCRKTNKYIENKKEFLKGGSKIRWGKSSLLLMSSKLMSHSFPLLPMNSVLPLRSITCKKENKGQSYTDLVLAFPMLSVSFFLRKGNKHLLFLQQTWLRDRLQQLQGPLAFS